MLIAECYLSLIYGDVAVGMWRANVFGPGADQPIVVELFDYMRSPSADAGDGKDRRKEVHVNAQGGVGGGRVEIHVGIEVFLVLHVLLNLGGHLVPLGIGRASKIAGHLAQVGGTRIFGVIDAMPEP